MPRIAPGHIDRLIAAFNPVEGRAICVPTYQGKRGNPVLFAARFFAEMAEAAGDSGAKHLIGQHEDDLVEVAMDDDGIFLDVDTPDALTAIRAAGME
jgi:molybdenum cofactor cytidylyltransferase